jgi:hypothetical protein
MSKPLDVPNNDLTYGGEFSLTRRSRFIPPGTYLVLTSDRGSVNLVVIVWLEGLGQLKDIQGPHQESKQ